MGSVGLWGSLRKPVVDSESCQNAVVHEELQLEVMIPISSAGNNQCSTAN